MTIDLRAALNAISDVVQSRPPPIREFDQIYMKVADLAIHAEFVARKLDGKSVLFVGDGDAVGLCIAHLSSRGILQARPRQVYVLDFDERLVTAVNEFARKYDLTDLISASLYNVVDPLPHSLCSSADAFHINPPWGRYNDGESIGIFLERGVQAVTERGWGLCVIGDDDDLEWTEGVLFATQQRACTYGLVMKEMIPGFHAYHLDDAPELRSCVMLFRMLDTTKRPANSQVSNDRLANFYGRKQSLRVHYVRQRPIIAPEMATPDTYYFEPLEENADDG